MSDRERYEVKKDNMWKNLNQTGSLRITYFEEMTDRERYQRYLGEREIKDEMNENKKGKNKITDYFKNRIFFTWSGGWRRPDRYYSPEMPIEFELASYRNWW